MRKYRPICIIVLLSLFTFNLSAQTPQSDNLKRLSFKFGGEFAPEDLSSSIDDTTSPGYSLFNYGFNYYNKNSYWGLSGGISSMFYNSDSGRLKVTQIPIGLHAGYRNERAGFEFGSGVLLNGLSDANTVNNGSYFYGRAYIFVDPDQILAFNMGFRENFVTFQNFGDRRRTVFSFGLTIHL